MQTLNLDRVRSKITTTPIATIADFHNVGEGVYRVTVKFSSKVNSENASIAISTALDNRCVAIENTFRKVNENHMSGFVSANRSVRDVNECDKLTFMSGQPNKVCAGNMLMDSSDNSLWEVKESGSGDKYLVRQEQEDLSELMVNASVRSIGAPSLQELSNHVSTQEYVAFVDTKQADVKFGFVLAGAENNEVTVVERQSKEQYVINDSQVVEAVNLNETDIFARTEEALVAKSKEKDSVLAAPAYDGADAELLKNYYRQVYYYNESFLNELETIIDNHSTI